MSDAHGATAPPLRERIAATPRPALIWAVVAGALLAAEFGALLEFTTSVVLDALVAAPGVNAPGWFVGFREFAGQIPTLLSRDVIPNQGYWNGSRYVGTFAGLSPDIAWALRLAVIYAYAFGCLGWAWAGYARYREHYRVANWTPRDDIVDRLRDHYWGLFGLAVVFMFLVMAIFAPAMGPTTVEQNLEDPYSYQVEYWDGGEVGEISAGLANRQSVSTGSENVGPMSYDNFGRFHPFGTLSNGKDLFTFIAAGSRISLIIGLVSVGLSAGFATIMALTSAFYKGKVDLTTVLVADAVMAMPQLLLLIMLTVVFSDHWVGDLYSGGALLALIFAGTGWPYMWRSLRGPALQVSEREWIDAARSFGQSPLRIMRKHMLPYILGYLLIYGSMTLGGAIIAISGLSFLGLGVSPPTPEWGRAVNLGQQYVGTPSWHISLIPGLLITLVVTGFNALGDGIRDAIDPESDSAEGEAGGRGGGA